MSISMEPNFLPLPNFYIIKDQNEHFVSVYNSDRQQHYRITAKGENEEKKMQVVDTYCSDHCMK